MNSGTIWFDGHLDLAWLAVRNRDMTASLNSLLAKDNPSACGETAWPPAVTLPALEEGGVRYVMGTLFTCPHVDRDSPRGPEHFPPGDHEAAHYCALKQMNWYHKQTETGGYLNWFPTGEPESATGDGRIQLILLMENASPIRSPEEVSWWVNQGLSAVGMTWNTSSQYAGGCCSNNGLSDAGRCLVRALDLCHIVHDLSHLSQRSTEELLGMSPGTIMASHSNCRALTGTGGVNDTQRHLSDETIREVGRRRGMIGLNLYHRFICYSADAGRRPAVGDLVDHAERICDITGNRLTVGLGSDMDGGFPADEMCQGIANHTDLNRVTDSLSQRGWSDTDIEGFTYQNWLRFWNRSGPNRNRSNIVLQKNG